MNIVYIDVLEYTDEGFDLQLSSAAPLAEEKVTLFIGRLAQMRSVSNCTLEHGDGGTAYIKGAFAPGYPGCRVDVFTGTLRYHAIWAFRSAAEPRMRTTAVT